MGLRYPVKINKVNNLSDARYCAGMGVDIIGLSNEISIEEISAITNWITGIDICLDIQTTSSNLSDLINQINPIYVEINDINLLNEEIIPADTKIIFQIDSGTYSDITSKCETLKSKVDLFHIKFGTLSKDEANQLSKQFDLILNVDGNSGEACEIIFQSLNPKLISLNGGTEIAPGLKNFDEMAEILEFLESNEE